MEKILNRIEVVVENWISEFEKNPIKAGVKLFIFYWIAKTIWKGVSK